MRAATALAVAVVAAATLLLVARGSGAPAAPPATAEPTLGVADAQMTLMGAVTDGGRPDETWAYRVLPLTAGEHDGFAAPDGQRQLAFLRYTDATGWQLAQTPIDQNGDPYRGMDPNALSAKLTPSGGGVLVGRDITRPSGDQLVVLARQPGARFKELPEPTVGTGAGDVLRPPQGGDPAEALAGGAGSGHVVDAVYDDGGTTNVLFAPIGAKAQDGVVRWDGQGWTREPVEIPDYQSGDSFEIVGIAATGPSNAWLLARVDRRLGRGIALFRRTESGGTVSWKDEGDLGGSQFATDPGVEPLSGPTEPLTVTSDGAWVDGKLSAGGDEYTFTLFYDPSSHAVTGSWCDAPGGVCTHELGAALSQSDGYRSFAWPGPGFGTRIITNPIDGTGLEATNRGTYLRLDGDSFDRWPGAGGNQRRGGAFATPDEGWLDGPTHITTHPEGPGPLREWPLTLRAPLTAVAAQPNAPPGALDSQALAVGADGGVVRYTPGKGWLREFLLTATGAVSKPTLRGVAWPEPGRAYAVGDFGAMWLWRSDTGLWEKDPATPYNFDTNMMDVGFDPSDPQRGYAVGLSGTLLRYDKTWTQESVPSGFERTDFTKVAFAGHQAMVAAGGDLLENDGGGWHVDQGLHDLLASARVENPDLFTVAGLPDGGAVAGGGSLVVERDGAGEPWRFADQPLPGSTVIAAAPVRPESDPSQVRAVVSVVPQLSYPQVVPLPPPDPNAPPPILPAIPLPPDGYVLHETSDGWRDEQHASFGGSGADRPVKADPALAFDLGVGGNGWAVGGWSGETDSAGRGSSGRNAQGRADRSRVQTAAAYRYGNQTDPTGASPAAIPLDAGPVRFAVGGHAQCNAPCADLAQQGIAPDRTLRSALAKVADLADRDNGPRFMLYTGGRLPRGDAPAPGREERRFAELLGSESSLPVFPAVSGGDSAGGTASAFESAFSGFAGPFGTASAPSGISDTGGGAAASGSARTHYAFDSQGPGGTVRVIVIDNSAGSLAASDPYQNPPEPQLPWLEAQLAQAKAAAIPSVVMGSRDLASGFSPALNVASDADQVAQALVDGGASAYFYERPEENRALQIPSGASTAIPEFGSGTLGYRSPIENVASGSQPDSLFGDTGFLLAELDASKRDPQTNRAPVTARLIPVIDDLSMDAVDGTLLRRSRTALFQGLGRRPLAGDRWGDISPSDGNADPPGGTPYTQFPPSLCQVAGCSTRIEPEYTFTSSDDDFGDFVEQDPASSNPRKPFLGQGGKPVTDPSSGLFCAFNAGTTTVTVSSGGLSYSQQVTVLPGSVQQPCGTRRLKPSRFTPHPAPVAPPPAPAPSPAPASSPPVSFKPPPPPAPAPPVPPKAAITPPKAVKPSSAPRPVPPPLAQLPLSAPPLAVHGVSTRVPQSPPPQPPTPPRPIPPGGAVARVYQVEERREQELATEESAAAAAYHPEAHVPVDRYLAGVAVLAALAGATILLAPRSRPRPRRARPVAAEAGVHVRNNRYRRSIR